MTMPREKPAIDRAVELVEIMTKEITRLQKEVEAMKAQIDDYRAFGGCLMEERDAAKSDAQKSRDELARLRKNVGLATYKLGISLGKSIAGLGKQKPRYTTTG